MNLIVEFANTMYQNEEQMPIEHQIDKWVLNDCLPLIAKEVEAKKRALKYVIGGGAEQPDSDCRFGLFRWLSMAAMTDNGGDDCGTTMAAATAAKGGDDGGGGNGGGGKCTHNVETFLEPG